MPPRVREVVRMLEAIGVRGDGLEALDGGPNHEVPKGRWERLRKRYAFKE